MYDALAGWARIEPPGVYGREYSELRRGWTTLFGALYFDGPSFARAVRLWRLRRPFRYREAFATRIKAMRNDISRSLGTLNRSFGAVIIASIAMSMPACRSAADELRKEIYEVAP
jgi:hypothetical protein